LIFNVESGPAAHRLCSRQHLRADARHPAWAASWRGTHQDL